MASDPQGKKMAAYLNNPQSYGLTRDAILEILSQLPLEYFCLCDEIATTEHPIPTLSCTRTQTCGSPQSSENSPTAHIERVQGTAKAEPGLHRQRGQVGGHRESGNLCGRQFL